GGARERRRPPADESPAGGGERLECGEAAPREERDRPAEPPTDPQAQDLARGEELGGALRRHPQRPAQLLRRPVERRIAERAPVLRREIDPPELEVARHVLEKVHELPPGAPRSAR